MSVRKRAVRVIIGFGYGLILATLALILTGLGEGTYVPLAISSAPLAVIEYPPPFTFFVGLIGCVVFWVCVAAIPLSTRRGTFRTLLVLHYVGVAIAVTKPIDGDWNRFIRAMRSTSPAFFPWIVFYVLGQTVIWLTANAAQPAAGADR